MKKRKYLVLLLLPLLLMSFLSVGFSQTISDTSLISMGGKDWSLKVDSALASSIDSRNTPYMTAKSSTEKELFLELATLEDCKSGVVQFKVDMTGLIAYKQLPLNEELDVKEYEFVNSTHAINDSKVVVYRPIEIVNSFALFDDAGRKQVHISATKLVDVNGVAVWCDSNLVDGVLSVVLPLEWCELAKFPIVLDPIFGYSDIAASQIEITSSLLACKFALGDDGAEVSELSWYVAGHWGTVNTTSAIYSDNAGAPSALLASSGIVNITTTPSWFNYSLTDTLDSGDYWLAIMGDGSGFYVYYDTGATNQSSGKDTSGYPNFPDPFSPDSWNYGTNKCSVYATYTTGESTPTPTPSPSPSPTPEGATATPFPEGAMDDTDWWISILVLLLIIINIFLMMLPFALVRFVFGILSLFLCMLALSYQVPLSPYLQTAGLLISALAMLFSVRARE